jgi:hypothetical protein
MGNSKPYVAVSTEDYRKKAQECREQAEQSILPHDKAEWLRLAQQWEKLAEGVEAARAAKGGASSSKDRP